MRGVFDKLCSSDRLGLSTSKNSSGDCLCSIFATGLQDKQVLELCRKLFGKLKLLTIYFIDPFLLILMISSASVSIIVGNFPVPTSIGLKRLPKDFDDEPLPGISLIVEILLLLASNIIGGNDDALCAQIEQ